MSFHEVQFPVDISYGSSGGPGFRTSIVEMDSGREQRVARWGSARRSYNVAEGVKTLDQLSELITFYIARQGPAHGFRYKDWFDFTTASNHRSAPTATDVVIGTGDGSETQFQLIKKYTSGITTRTRTLNKPIANTVLVAFDGTPQPSGWTVDDTTGIITFTSAPSADVVITAGCEFDVPVRFGSEVDEALAFNYEAFDSGSTQVPLVEIKDDLTQEDEFFCGGAKRTEISADYVIGINTGRVQVIVPTTTGLTVKLPATGGLKVGCPLFFIINDSVNSFTLKNNGGGTICTVAGGAGVEMVLSLNNSAQKIWYAK